MCPISVGGSTLNSYPETITLTHAPSAFHSCPFNMTTLLNWRFSLGHSTFELTVLRTTHRFMSGSRKDLMKIL